MRIVVNQYPTHFWLEYMLLKITDIYNKHHFPKTLYMILYIRFWIVECHIYRVLRIVSVNVLYIIHT